MLINNKYNKFKALKVTGSKFFIFIAFNIVLALLSEYIQTKNFIFSTELLAILGSGVGVFLAFRINSGYDRWWEARKIWGEMVNVSRTFGLAITGMISKQKFSEMTEVDKNFQREIIYGHIGFINALRMHLRKNDEHVWNNELWERELNNGKIFSPKDQENLKNKFNKPAQILQLQSQKISHFFDSDSAKDYRYVELIRLLKLFYDIQGKCERIKNTVFPWGYAFYTHAFVWLMAFLIPLGFIDSWDLQDIYLCAAISTTFITIEQVGSNLDKPFEDSFNDTPMSALCRSIEIDLLEQLGEPRTEPLSPYKGVLK